MKKYLALSAIALLSASASCWAAGAAAGVSIRYLAVGNEMAIAFTSSKGTIALCDPSNVPGELKPDLITVSHAHHLGSYPDYARVSLYKPETFAVKDVSVTGIPASHTVAPISAAKPDFMIYLFQMDGLRIAYFACIGQAKFTDEQMAALGKVDVALVTVDDYPGWISVKNACALMKQLDPAIIVPLTHHYSDYEAALRTLSASTGRKLREVKGGLELRAADLAGWAGEIVRLR
jgi:hypothetical protein